MTALAVAAPGDWHYPYEAQPKQALAHRRWAKERLYGGGAGGGKTDWLLAEVLAPIFRFGVNGLLLRRNRGQLEAADGITQRLIERIPPHVGRYNAGKHVWRFAHGPILQLGYLRNDGDVMQYVGGQFGVIGWDQLEEFSEWQYRRMFHPLRVREHQEAAMAAAGVEPYMVATANPGGQGHHWVKGRWIDPAPPNVVWQPNPTMDEPAPGTRCFIPALLEDNKYLGKAYERQLDSLPEDVRAAIRHGDWDALSGSRFGRLWKRAIHVVDPEEVPIPTGAGIARAAGVDYGLEAPWCALWGAKLGDGLVVVYRELYEAGLTSSEQAEAMRAAEAPGERIAGRPLPTFADPSMWQRRHDKKVPKGQLGTKGPPPGSIAHAYYAAGVPIQKADNDRLSGTALMADKLRVRADGWPRLVVYSTCLNLIRTLPGLPRDKANPELYGGDEDHAADALRYLLKGLEPLVPPAAYGGGAGRPRPPQPGRPAPRDTGLESETAGLRTRQF